MKDPVFTRPPEINGLIQVQLDYFIDDRGLNTEGYNQEKYSRYPEFAPLAFPVLSYSFSRQGVLRGGHGDKDNWKLIKLLHGDMQFIVVDLREDSPTYLGVFETFVNYLQCREFLVPPGCVNFHLALSQEVVFQYQLSQGYVEPARQIHLKWNDPRFNFKWLIGNPILSERDK